MTDLPEGIDQDDVLGTAMVLSFLATTVTLSSSYLDAGEEDMATAEAALHEHLERIEHLGSEFQSALIMSLATCIAVTGDEATVQSWLDQQAAEIAAALRG